MKVCEIFNSIQGEGPMTGRHRTFIRLSGCTRECSWCDTRYHAKGIERTWEDVATSVWPSTVVWTGGEPLLQWDEMKQVMDHWRKFRCMTTLFPITYMNELETNGDLLGQIGDEILSYFEVIVVSPKELANFDFRQWMFHTDKIHWKFVTDALHPKWDEAIYNFAVTTLIPKDRCWLQPITMRNQRQDASIKKLVWDLAVKWGWNYSPRSQIDVWGAKKKRV